MEEDCDPNWRISRRSLPSRLSRQPRYQVSRELGPCPVRAASWVGGRFARLLWGASCKNALNSSMSLGESRQPRETTLGISKPKARIPGQVSPKVNQVVNSEATYFEKEIVN